MGLRLGVVATLGALAACNGRYEVGEGDGGEAGSLTETGGSGGGGQGGAGGGQGSAGGTGGSSTAGSDSSGGTGGTSTGAVGGAPSAGTGGSSIGGSTSTVCDFVPPDSLPDPAKASPEVVWRRISRFLYDEERQVDLVFPQETTHEWVTRVVSSLLDAHHEAGEGAPAGLAKFIRNWAFAGNETETAAEWAAPLVDPGAGFVTELFGPRASDASRKSMLEDEAFLSAFPRPSYRGAWILRNLMCLEVGTPPIGTSDPAPAPGPSQTSRQALEAYTSSEAACVGCHRYIDPVGFSLENYDSSGAPREFDNGLPVDTSGTFNFDVYGDISFVDNAHLLSQITPLCEVGACFSSALLDYAIDQAYAGEGPEILPVERQYVLAALASEYHRLRPMVLAVVTTPAFLKE